ARRRRPRVLGGDRRLERTPPRRDDGGRRPPRRRLRRRRRAAGAAGVRLSAFSYRLWGAGLSAAESGRHAAESPLNPPAAPADTRDTWRAAALPESQGMGALPVSAGPHSLTPWPHDRARSAPARQPRRRPPPPHRPRRRRLPGEPPPPLLLPPRPLRGAPGGHGRGGRRRAPRAAGRRRP